MRPAIEVSTDLDGVVLAHIPLGADGEKTCTIEYDDFFFLMKLGVSALWSCTSRNYVVCNGKGQFGHKLGVARVLLDVGRNEMIEYRDGNPLNLRRSNLKVTKHKRGRQESRRFVPKPKTRNEEVQV